MESLRRRRCVAPVVFVLALAAFATAVPATAQCTQPPLFGGLETATSGVLSTCTNHLSWSPATPSCGGTITYSVYRAPSSGLTPARSNRIASGLAGTSFDDDLNLTSDETYYYIVRAVEVSDVTFEEENGVERSAQTTAAWTPVLRYFDDLDGNRPPNAGDYWLENSSPLNVVTGCHFQSATNAWRFGAGNTSCGGTYSNNVNVQLRLGGDGSGAANGFDLAGANRAAMRFYLWYNLEKGYDGAFLSYSTSGANGPWTQIPDLPTPGEPQITAGGYTGTIQSGSRRVWNDIQTPANGSLRQVDVDLNALVGQTVWFAWTFSTDNSVGREGLYLDDVDVRSDFAGACTTFVPPPGPAVKYRIDLAAAAVAGSPETFDVTAFDAVDLLASDYAGPASFSSSDAAASLPPGAVVFTGGQATGLETTLRTAGSQTVTATDVGDPELTGSAAVDVAPAGSAQVGFHVEPTDTVAGVAISPAVEVEVQDEFGNRIPTATDEIIVDIADNPAGGTLSGTSTVAATAGVAVFPDLSIERAASGYTLVASASGLGAVTSAPFAILPAADHHLTFEEQPTAIAAGYFFAPPVTVALRDSFGNQTFSNAVVGLALGVNPGGGTLLGSPQIAATDGLATFADLSVNRTGSGYTLVASSGALVGDTSVPFDVAHGTPYRAVFEQQPSDVDAGHVMAPPVEVAVRDYYDNRCTTYASAVSIAFANNPSGATLGGQLHVLPANGVASFGDLTVSLPGANFTLFAGASGLYGATSVGFDVLDPRLFGDGFESGDTDAWSAVLPLLLRQPLVAARDQLSVALVVPAALREVASEKGTAIFAGTGSGERPLFAVELVRDAAGAPAVRARAFDAAGGSRASGWFALEGAAPRLELAWWRATPGRTDGLLLLSIDGAQVAALTDLADAGEPLAVVWRAVDIEGTGLDGVESH